MTTLDETGGILNGYDGIEITFGLRDKKQVRFRYRFRIYIYKYIFLNTPGRTDWSVIEKSC